MQVLKPTDSVNLPTYLQNCTASGVTNGSLTFQVGGTVPDHAIQRAIDLSREKYCSVWHSLQPDIMLDTRFHVTPAPFDSAKG